MELGTPVLICETPQLPARSVYCGRLQQLAGPKATSKRLPGLPRLSLLFGIHKVLAYHCCTQYPGVLSAVSQQLSYIQRSLGQWLFCIA